MALVITIMMRSHYEEPILSPTRDLFVLIYNGKECFRSIQMRFGLIVECWILHNAQNFVVVDGFITRIIVWIQYSTTVLIWRIHCMINHQRISPKKKKPLENNNITEGFDRLLLFILSVFPQYTYFGMCFVEFYIFTFFARKKNGLL